MPKRRHPELHALPAKRKPLPKQDPDRPSVNDLKKQIRNAKRLLARDDLPADSRIVQERALAGYERELGEETRRRHRSEMIGKYHFVRFLDRKSATKELKKLLRREKEANESDTPLKETDRDSLTQRIHIARVNLNYTIYYPLTEKYVSLYAEKEQKKRPKESDNSNSDGEGQDSENDDDNHPARPQPCSTEAPKPVMWRVVEKCMQEGQEKLDLLREGKLDDASASKDADGLVADGDRAREKTGSGGRPTAPSHDRAKRKDKKDKNVAGDKRKGVEIRDAYSGEENVNDDSDGGFFE